MIGRVSWEVRGQERGRKKRKEKERDQENENSLLLFFSMFVCNLEAEC